MKKFLAFVSLVLLTLGLVSADVTQNQKVYAAANIVKAFACDNNRSVDYNYVKEAKAVAIIPNVVKSGAVVSASSGDGIFIMKDFDGKWTSPVFIKYKGLGIGAQVGIESADLILIFQTSKSFMNLFEGMDTLELNAGVSAVKGYSAGFVTDYPELSAWIVKTGKTSGVYLGAAVDINRLSVDQASTNDYYEKLWDVTDILNGSPKDSQYTKMLKDTLDKYFGNYQYYCDCVSCPCNASKTYKKVKK